MGLPMARALLDAGFEVCGFDVKPVSAFGDFSPHMIESAEEFAARSDIVISVVRDYNESRDLFFRRQGIFTGDERPADCVICSTLATDQLSRLREELDDGIRVMDAPMSGAPVAAEQRSLTFMVGGDEADFQRHRPLFEAMGRRIQYLGEFGAGMKIKLLNNYVCAAGVVAVRRALNAAEKLNIGPQQLLNIMADSSGNTWYGENFQRISWAREGYDGGNTLGILEKDVMCAIQGMNVGGVAPSELDAIILDQLRNATPMEFE